MKKSLKGALLSGLVYPGVGQFWLGCYLRGSALMLAVTVGLAVVVHAVSQQALALLGKMEAEGAVDMVALLKSASRTPDDPLTTAASAAVVLCWIIGTLDAYVMGRKRDLADQAKR